MYEMNKRYIHSYKRTKDLLNTSEILTSVFTQLVLVYDHSHLGL